MEPYRLALPVPPSLNVYYQNAKRQVRAGPKAGKEYIGRMISPEGLAFRGEVSFAARRGHRVPPKLSGPLCITVLVSWPMHTKKGAKRPTRKGDVDNLWKCLLDALTHADVIGDDVQFDDIRMMRGNPVHDGRLWLCITRFDPVAAQASAAQAGLPFGSDISTAVRDGDLPF